MERIPKIAAINDMSGIGRCSLTVALPIISSMGVQVCPVPTAILSSQTDGFDDFSFLDLSSNMEEFIDKWENLQMSFDCIYSGFLASAKQIDIVSDFIDKFRTDSTTVIVDPVMGDNKELYSTYTDEMKEKMIDLVKKADVITPNITEACFILDRQFPNQPLNDCEVYDMLMALSDLGPDKVAITGIKSLEFGYTNVAYQRDLDMYKSPYLLIPKSYPGAGDIFASIVTAGLAKSTPFFNIVEKATHFLSNVIQYTYTSKSEPREGILFEPFLSELNDDYK